MARFKQGKSGNPEGRPKGSVSITSAIRRKLEETNPKTKRQYVDDLVDVMIDKALREKDFRVIKEIWNHIDGLPKNVLTEGNSAQSLVFLPSKEHEEKANEAIRQFLNISKEATERFKIKAN